MRTFQEFVLIAEAAYDASVMSSSQIRRTGEGGRIGAERKKSAPERRRMKAVGGGKMEPAKEYKPRKDIGTQRPTSTRVQQPEKERGSAALSPKEAQRKAYLERKAKERGEAQPTTASQLLAKKKKETVSPDYKPQKASGKTRAERDRERNKAKSEMLKQRKAKLFADYKEVHGKNPTGKEKTRLLGLAHQSMKG